MLSALLNSLRLRFGLRARRWPCAVRIRRPRPYGPRAPFTVVMRDGFQMIEPRAMR